jgi:hypothetical protein
MSLKFILLFVGRAFAFLAFSVMLFVKGGAQDQGHPAQAPIMATPATPYGMIAVSPSTPSAPAPAPPAPAFESTQAPQAPQAPTALKIPIQQHAPKQTEACVPYTAEDFARDTEGISRADLDRLRAITPRRKRGFKSCTGKDGHGYFVQEAYLTQTTDVYTAPFVETVIDTLAAGSEVYVIESNGKYVNIQYIYGAQLYSGWVNYANMSLSNF